MGIFLLEPFSGLEQKNEYVPKGQASGVLIREEAERLMVTLEELQRVKVQVGSYVDNYSL